jgi:hypothetical protein
MTGQSLALSVLQELDVVGASDTADQADVVYVLARVNRILSLWTAKWGPAVGSTITSYVCTPALQPHLIGPTGTFVVSQRPVSIEAVNVVSGTARTPLTKLTTDEWMALSDPTWTGDIPEAFNYRATSPNGSLFLYPVVSAAATVEILTRGILGPLTLTGTVYLAPGYEEALVLTVSEGCAKHFHATPPDRLEASKARAIIEAANSTTPRLRTDAPGVNRGRANILTGMGSTDWVE